MSIEEELPRDVCAIDQIVITDQADPAAVLLADFSPRPDVQELVRNAPSDGLQASVGWRLVVLTDGQRLARCDVTVSEPRECAFSLAHFVDAEVAEAFARNADAWLVDVERVSVEGERLDTVDGEPLHPLRLPVDGPPWSEIAERIRAGE